MEIVKPMILLVITFLLSQVAAHDDQTATSFCSLTTNPKACEEITPERGYVDATVFGDIEPLDFKEIAAIAEPEVVNICKQVKYSSFCVLTYYVGAKGKMDKNLMRPLTILDMELRVLKDLLAELEDDISSHPDQLSDYMDCGLSFDNSVKELTVAEEAMKTEDMRSVKACLKYALEFNSHCEKSIQKLKKTSEAGQEELKRMKRFASTVSIMAKNCRSLANAIKKNLFPKQNN